MLKEDQAEAKENKHFFFITSSTFRLSNHCKYVFTQWWRKDEPLVGSRVSRCLSLCSHSIKSGLHRCHSASFVSHCLPINRHLLFFSWWPLFVQFVLNECAATQWLIHGRNDESLGGAMNETLHQLTCCVWAWCVSLCVRRPALSDHFHGCAALPIEAGTNHQWSDYNEGQVTSSRQSDPSYLSG